MKLQKKITAEMVWTMFAQAAEDTKNFKKEIGELFRKTDEKFAETDRKFAETDRKFAETERRFQETDRILSEKFAETDRKFAETNRILSERFAKTDKRINQMIGHFDKQLGKLIEALTEKCTIKLFQGKGVKITHSTPNPTKNFAGKTMEFDTILQNNNEIVVIEAKVSLNKQKVYKHVKKMEEFKTFFKEYKSYKTYSCLAFVTGTNDACELAEENGLFLIKLKNEEYFEFSNTDNFKPRIF